MAGSIGVLPDNWTFVKRKPRLEEEAGGGARWSKEQGGREGAENGVDYQVWSSVQCPVKYIELKIRRLKNFGVEEIVENVS